MADIQLLLEAERRGLLPPDKKALLDEARRRGLIQDAGVPAATTQVPAPVEKPEEQSGLRQVADVPLQMATGVAQGVRFITDIFGADNPLSQSIRGVEGTFQDLLSAQAKQDQQEISRIMKEAEDKGILDQVIAGLKAFSTAPVDFLSQAAGTAVPTALGGVAAAALRAPAVAARAARLGIGALSGAGITKSSIYDATKQTLIENGVSPEEAERRASAAQSYGGGNLDQIVLGAVAGSVAGGTGVEKNIAARILKRAGVEQAAEGAVEKGVIRNLLGEGVAEAAPEAAQAAQEQLATNVALQREGIDTPLMRGVVGSAALEGIAGGFLGAGLARRGAAPKAETTQEDTETTQEDTETTAPPPPDTTEPAAPGPRERVLSVLRAGEEGSSKTKSAIQQETGLSPPEIISAISKLKKEGAISYDSKSKGWKFVGQTAEPTPAESVDLGMLTTGQFVPGGEEPSGAVTTTPVGEAVDTTVGRGAVVPPSGVGTAEPGVAGPAGEGVETTVSPPNAPDVREGELSPALKKPTPIEKQLGIQPTENQQPVDRVAAIMNAWNDVLSGGKLEGAKDFTEERANDVLDQWSKQLPENEQAQFETIRSKPGVNAKRLAKMLGPQLYGDPTDMAQISVKEILQNSYDAIKTMLEKNKIDQGRIHIVTDDKNRTITMTDNGSGMTPQILGTKFLEIAGSGKETDRASGGFGIAKMQFLYANKAIHVTTMRDGKVAELNTTGEQLFDALENGEAAPDIQVRNPTEQDNQMFPSGHGTHISLAIPESFKDPQTDTNKEIYFPYDASDIASVTKSPLFENIKVTYSRAGRNNFYNVNNVGANFKADDYDQFANVKFNWGNAKIYVTRSPIVQKWGDNVDYLSNGLHQFSTRLTKDGNLYGPGIPHHFIVNLEPKIKADEAGYPITFNRKGLTEAAQKELGQVMRYIQGLYGYSNLASEAESFGRMQYFDKDGKLSAEIDLKPTVPPTKTNFDFIKKGDTVKAENGKIYVNGKELPELTPEQLKASIPEASSLKIDENLLEPNKVAVHDNVVIKPPQSWLSRNLNRLMLRPEANAEISMGDYLRELHGARYDQYIHGIGTAFQLLRNKVSEILDYPDLKKDVVGISIDKEYRGVSTVIPFSGSFINPLVPEAAHIDEQAYGLLGTMIHELAHHKVRDHNHKFPAEMQRIIYKLEGAKNFDYEQFKKQLVSFVRNFEDIINDGRKAIESDDSRPAAKRLEDSAESRSSEVRDERDVEGDSGPSGDVRTGQRVFERSAESSRPAGQGRPANVGATNVPAGKPSVKAQPAPSAGPTDNKGRTPAEAIKARQDTYKERFSKKSLVDRMLRYLNGKDSGPARLNKYEALVRKFQNDLRPALTLERELKRAAELITFGPGMNDAYTKISAAQDKAAWLTSTRLKQPMDAAYKAIESYARSRNLTTDQAIEELDRFRIVLHEPERRLIMFMRYVPLSTKRRAFKASNGKTIQISPAEIRDSILQSLVKPGNDLVSNGQAKQLHNVLKALVSDPANLDPLGASPIKKEGKPLSTDINADQYSVLAGYSPEFIKQWGDSYNALGRDKAGADAAIKAIEKIQDVTKELNRMGGYWSKPVDNIVEFYNFAHYTPFKGVPGTRVRAEAEMTDPNDVRVSGEFADADQAMEGRETEADNSVLQSFSDALYAASRAGRAGVTEAVKNLIEQGHISGKKIAEITHEQRWLDKDFNLRQYKGRNKLFHYNDEGNIEVYQIANKDLGFLESIRRPYQVDNWTTKMANSLTGLMGQLHTRFNPSFAPLNFPRDVFTNTMAISADVGGKEAMSYLSDALFHNVMKGGLQKSAKVSKLLSEGNIAELRRLAKDNPFYADTLELLEEGGRTAYKQATTLQAQADAIEDMLAPNGVVKSGKAGLEAIGKWADMYNDAFEFTNRVAAYGVMKNNISARLKKEFREKNGREPNAQELAQINKAARTEGASFSKNLANFRLVGTAGRQAGGLFMFFRASATGAVRAIDSLMPAFVDEKTALSQAPASVRDNPQAVQKYLKNYRENKRRAQWTMFTVAAAGAALYTLALAGADDDDQGRNKVATDDMARWTRYARLPILGKDTVLQIPWGFGISAFGALGAQVAALAGGNQSAKEMAANTINIAFDSFIPLPKSNINIFDNFPGFLVDSVTPTILRPFVEFAMNTDNLGNEIYNSRQAKYSDAFTGGTNVPELYKDVSKRLLESTGLDISPNSLYFWASNYADALSRVATSTYDLRLFASGDRELRSVDDLDRVLLPFDSFIGTKSNYDGRQYEAVKNQIEDKRRVIKSLESRPEAFKKYIDEHPTDLELIDFYNNAVNGELKYLQENSNQIKTSKELSFQQRRDMLKENARMQNLVKRNLIDTFKMYGVEP